MWIGIVSVLPEMLQIGVSGGVFARAVKAGIVDLAVFDPRDYVHDRHRTVDDKSYGGGPGMVMLYAPLAAALEAARQAAPNSAPVVLLSPQGVVFDQDLACEESKRDALILVCGRYEGLDERFIARHVDAEWSIGDYVLSGGELPALVVMDAIARQIPGTLGNALSIKDESHLDGLLDYPHYTRPVESDHATVPEVLLSGDHKKVNEYRRREALGRTFDRRPEMLTQRVFSEHDRKLLRECFDRRSTPDRNEA